MQAALGEKVKSLRQELGLTQMALGELVGATAAFIWQIEKGVYSRNPKREKLQKLADALQVDVEVLMDTLESSDDDIT